MFSVENYQDHHQLKNALHSYFYGRSRPYKYIKVDVSLDALCQQAKRDPIQFKELLLKLKQDDSEYISLLNYELYGQVNAVSQFSPLALASLAIGVSTINTLLSLIGTDLSLILLFLSSLGQLVIFFITVKLVLSSTRIKQSYVEYNFLLKMTEDILENK